MINKAIEKLTKEMMKLNDPFAQAIEEHLTEICTSNAAAEQIESTRQENEAMAQRVKELEAKIDNVSNESLMLFKPKVDQLQKIYQECQEAAAETPDPGKTKAALVQIMEALIGQEA